MGTRLWEKFPGLAAGPFLEGRKEEGGGARDRAQVPRRERRRGGQRPSAVRGVVLGSWGCHPGCRILSRVPLGESLNFWYLDFIICGRGGTLPLGHLLAARVLGPLGQEGCCKFGGALVLVDGRPTVTGCVSHTGSENSTSKNHYLLGTLPKQGRARYGKKQSSSESGRQALDGTASSVTLAGGLCPQSVIASVKGSKSHSSLGHSNKKDECIFKTPGPGLGMR